MSEEKTCEAQEINPMVGESYYHRAHGKILGIVDQVDENYEKFQVLMNFSTPKNYDKIWTSVKDLSTEPFKTLEQKKKYDKAQRIADNKSAQ